MRNHLDCIIGRISGWFAPRRKDGNKLRPDVREKFHEVDNKVTAIQGQIRRAERDPHALKLLAEAMQERARDVQ